ncbi:MAG: hypothetical protein GC162_09715 [Planctomycetes bacterium]|nr:hypothetical protein [Planctomycetota bacterium]
MIDLACPQCESELEIDDGFRGGVCRCFNCGTLMTVPDDPDANSPESLSRPDSPSSFGPGSTSRKLSVYRTKTGKTIELSERQISGVPVARKKRMGVRIGVVSVMIIIVLSVVGVVIYGMSTLFKPKRDVTAVEAWPYDPDANPFTETRPSFMGIPAGKKTIIMIDASTAMRDYLDVAKQAALAAVSHLGPEHEAQVVFWSESGPRVFPGALTNGSGLSPNALAAQFDSVVAGGALAAPQAFAAALKGNPDKIILVAKLLPSDAELAVIANQVKQTNAVLDVILLDNSNETLNKIAKDTGGEVHEMPAGQIQRWYEKFLRAGGQPITATSGGPAAPAKSESPNTPADGDKNSTPETAK